VTNRVRHHSSIVINLAAAMLLLLASGAIAWLVLPSAWITVLNSSVTYTVALIRSWGPWGVVGSIGLMIVHSFLPFPAEIIALANGMIYGPVWGAAITWVGAMLGASAAFGLVRLLGRPFVRRFLPDHHWRRLADWSHAHGGAALLISRLIPLIAFNLINFAAALTEISWWTFLWATGLGILPLTVLLAVLGDSMLTLPLWALVLIVAVVLVGWIASKFHARSVSKHGGASV
jgi:uncharacterized membrane protein YdjX (TVP38/TMEM64 family)